VPHVSEHELAVKPNCVYLLPPVNVRAAAEAGFDHHLTRPADPERLARLIAGNEERAM
jgi:hypothetical protein